MRLSFFALPGARLPPPAAIGLVVSWEMLFDDLNCFICMALASCFRISRSMSFRAFASASSGVMSFHALFGVVFFDLLQVKQLITLMHSLWKQIRMMTASTRNTLPPMMNVVGRKYTSPSHSCVGLCVGAGVVGTTVGTEVGIGDGNAVGIGDGAGVGSCE